MSAAAAAPRVAGGRSPSIGGRDGGGGAYAGLAMSFQFKGRVPRSRRWGELGYLACRVHALVRPLPSPRGLEIDDPRECATDARLM